MEDELQGASKIRRSILSKTIVFLALSFFFSTFSWGIAPLITARGARPLAMGNAYVGLADDGSGIFINPAGLSSIKQASLISLYTQPESNTAFTLLGGALPNYFGGTIGIGYRNRTLSSVQISAEVVDYTIQDILFFYAHPINNYLSLGGDIRVVSEGFSRGIPGLESANGSGTAIDLSLKYIPKPWFTAGVSLQNLTAKINYQQRGEVSLPGNNTFGVSFEKEKFIFNLDLSQSADEPQALLHSGVEWKGTEIFALRFGLDQTPKTAGENYTHITLGFGLKYRGTTFDYTYYKQGDPSQTVTHYLSLGYVGAEEIKPEKKPEPPPLPTPEAAALRKIKRVHFKDIPEDYWAKEIIELAATAGLVSGYPDGTFRPKEKLARKVFSILLLTAKNISSENPVREIGGIEWGKDPEKFVLREETGKIMGLEKKMKRPKDPINRAEFAALLSETYFGRAAIKRLPTLEEEPKKY